MISAGRANTISKQVVNVGRKELCLEDTRKPATSSCSKLLTNTVTRAHKGLSQKQKKLWQKYVFQPAVQKVVHFCDGRQPVIIPGGSGGQPNGDAIHRACVMKVLQGVWKFDGLYRSKHKWVDYLTKGAQVVKKLAPQKRAPQRTNRAAE